MFVWTILLDVQDLMMITINLYINYSRRPTSENVIERGNFCVHNVCYCDFLTCLHTMYVISVDCLLYLPNLPVLMQ